ncbi:hypothetical protein VTO73DRAFT_10041 [Trametes versicolor]
MAAEQKPHRAVEVLEIEDEEQRQERMHGLLARLNASSPESNGSTSMPRPFDLGDRSTHPAGPPLELLSRIQAFLPELAASNADLLRRAQENPESVDIENVGEDQEQYIEMDLGLGVFDHHGEIPAGIPVADVDFDVAMDNSDSDSGSSSEDDSDDSSSDSSSEEDSSSGSDSDSDVDIVVSSGQEKKARPKKPLPKRNSTFGEANPDIVVLSETVEDSAPTK